MGTKALQRQVALVAPHPSSSGQEKIEKHEENCDVSCKVVAGRVCVTTSSIDVIAGWQVIGRVE